MSSNKRRVSEFETKCIKICRLLLQIKYQMLKIHCKISISSSTLYSRILQHRFPQSEFVKQNCSRGGERNTGLTFFANLPWVSQWENVFWHRDCSSVHRIRHSLGRIYNTIHTKTVLSKIQHITFGQDLISDFRPKVIFMAIWFKLNYLEKRNKLLDECIVGLHIELSVQ